MSPIQKGKRILTCAHGRAVVQDKALDDDDDARRKGSLLVRMSKITGDRIVSSSETGTDTDRKYKFKWLLGTDGSKRRFFFFMLKAVALLYGIFLFVAQYVAVGYLVLSAQRWGWLLHGKSFYLPHHTPESMRKTGMNYRNIFFTIAQKRGYSHRDIERMILMPTNAMLELSPIARDTNWRPAEAQVEEALAANELPTSEEVAAAKGEMKDARTTRAAATAAAAADSAGGDGNMTAYTLQLIDDTFRRVRPSEMFDAGEGQPFVRLKGGTRSLLRKSGPITLIIFPGVISEMIDPNGPFGELPIWETSSFAKEWKARLAHCAQVEHSDEWDRGGSSNLDHHLVCDHTDTVDKRLFLDHLEIKPDTMENLVAVGSIDAIEGDGSGGRFAFIIARSVCRRAFALPFRAFLCRRA